VYDDVDIFTIKGSIEYKMAEKITMAANVEFNNYKTDKLKEALYVPAVKFGLNGQYAIAQKIYIKADVFYNGEANAIENINKTPETRFVKLKSFVDLNLGVDYRYSKVLSVFANLNNLGFARYFRYYNYPSYRFNAMAGLTYSF
jgi:outer membrane receptor protein involved in Fe transport